MLAVAMLFTLLLPAASGIGEVTAKASGSFTRTDNNSTNGVVKPISFIGNQSETEFDVEEINAEREAHRAEEIGALAATGVFDASFVEALTDLYSIYDEDLYVWLANLYDPEIGGFYYSNSARDNVGFLPDLESTAQALQLLDKSGLDGVYNDVIGETLSDETRLQLYLFAHSLYSSDGYYYHPQWGTSISSSRKGRDKSCGNQILNALDPNTDGDSNPFTYTAAAESSLVLPLASSSIGNLSGVAAAAIEDYSSPEAVSSASPVFSTASWTDLKAYVDYWIFTKEDSYTMGNTINANVSAITNAGLRDDLTEYLAEIQYDNGLWEEETTYNAINGLMKLCGIFGGSYISFPKATEAVESLLSILIGEISEDGTLTSEGLAESKTIVYVYNPWVAMYKLVGAVTNEGNKAEIANILKEYAPELMGNVSEKLKAFNRDDGGFSYYQTKTSHKAQSAPVAVAGSCESDVNSTGIAISTIRYVLRVYQLYCNYNFTIPTLYFEADSDYFLSILEARTPVEKVIKVEHPETATFDDESYIDSSVVDEETAEGGIIGNGGVALNPYYNVFNNVNDSTPDENGNFKWFSSSIVSSPTDATDKVLYAAVYVENGASASSASNTQFNIVNSGVNGNTYVFEADIYVDSSSLTAGTNVCVAQITLGNKYTSLYDQTMDLYATTTADGATTLYIQESSYNLGSEAVRTRLASGITANGWFKLRIELTKVYGEDSVLEEITQNTYINGSLTSEGVNTGRYSSSNGYYDYDINAVRISYYRTTPSRIYIDDAYAAKVSAEGSALDYYAGSSFDHYGVDPDQSREAIAGSYDMGKFDLTLFRDNNEGYLMEIAYGESLLYYTYGLVKNADGTFTLSPEYYSREGESGTNKSVCFASLAYSVAIDGENVSISIIGDNDHLCDLCGDTLTDCADSDRNAACDICGAAAITVVTESADCAVNGGTLKSAHLTEGLTASPAYGGAYTLDFWCVYSVSGSTVTLIDTFEAGSSYVLNSQGVYKISPVFVANTLGGVSDNSYSADLSSTDKVTTANDCLDSDWADQALSGKFNVYSGSSPAPLGNTNVTQLYLVSDPTNGANTVLAWMSTGTGGTGYGNAVMSFDLDDTVAGSTYVIDFDYYVDYTYYSGASLYTAIGVAGTSSSYELARINHGGAAMSNYSLNPDNIVTPGSATSYYSLSTRTSSGSSSGVKSAYDTDTWYSVKLIITNNNVYTFIGLRGSDSYILIDTQAFSGISASGIDSLNITAGIYKNRSVIYYDNIGFYSAAAAPCIDSNGDCVCDICGTSICIDDNGDHLCDLCGSVLTICADNDENHLCDLCGEVLTQCADTDANHLCDLCGDTLTDCADSDRNAACDICGAAAITVVTESADCAVNGGTLKSAHLTEGLTASPAYGGAYTLDFWCVYSVSGSTVTLIDTFEAGSSYVLNSQGVYKISPVFVANTLGGVSDNSYSADLSSTDKVTTANDCLDSDWADQALSGKFNVYSGSSPAPLGNTNVTQLYLVSDPTNGANTVLAWMSTGTGGTGYGNAVMSFDLDDTVAGSTYVIDFDYYVDYTYYSGASLYTAIGVAGTSSSYELARINHGGAAMSNYSLNPDNIVTPGSATSYYSLSTRTSSGSASGIKSAYDTDTWYSVRIVVENDTVATYLALRGTNEYTLLDSQSFAGISSSGLGTLTLTAGIYKNRSVIYYDNISFCTAE